MQRLLLPHTLTLCCGSVALPDKKSWKTWAFIGEKLLSYRIGLQYAEGAESARLISPGDTQPSIMDQGEKGGKKETDCNTELLGLRVRRKQGRGEGEVRGKRVRDLRLVTTQKEPGNPLVTKGRW